MRMFSICSHSSCSVQDNDSLFWKVVFLTFLKFVYSQHLKFLTFSFEVFVDNVLLTSVIVLIKNMCFLLLSINIHLNQSIKCLFVLTTLPLFLILIFYLSFIERKRKQKKTIDLTMMIW